MFELKCISIISNSLLFPGIFTPSDDLAKEVLAASEISGEKFWRMPMEDSYWESMKSSVADMVNTGGRPGGAITAALFLKQVDIIFLSNLHKWTSLIVSAFIATVFTDQIMS